jgi:hypothetical protein
MQLALQHTTNRSNSGEATLRPANQPLYGSEKLGLSGIGVLRAYSYCSWMPNDVAFGFRRTGIHIARNKSLSITCCMKPHVVECV